MLGTELAVLNILAKLFLNKNPNNEVNTDGETFIVVKSDYREKRGENTMYKVIRIDENTVYIGNPADNSLKRVAIEKSYEGVKLGDFVEFFSDGYTLLIMKLEKNVESPALVNIEGIPDLGLKNLDFSNVIPALKKFIERVFLNFKYQKTYIGLGLFLGVISTVVLAVAMLLNKELTTFLQPSLGEYSGYLMDQSFSFSPLLILANSMLATITFQFSDIWGVSENISNAATIAKPLFLLSVVSIAAGMYALKRYIVSKSEEIELFNLLADLISVGLLGQVVLAVILALSSQTVSEFVVIKVDVTPMLYNGTFLVILIALLIVASPSMVKKSEGIYFVILSIFRQKVILYSVVGVLGSLMIFIFTPWKSFILLGNYASMLMALSFGARGSLNLNGQVQSMVDYIPNFMPVLIFIMIANILIMIIDLDDIYSHFQNIKKYVFSIIYGLSTFMIVLLLANLATITMNVSLNGISNSMRIGVDFDSFIMGIVITCGFSAARLSISQKNSIISGLKKKYRSLLTYIRF